MNVSNYNNKFKMAEAKRVCFICGGKGHINKNCPERTKPDNSHAAKM
jgi:hypothetical protein